MVSNREKLERLRVVLEGNTEDDTVLLTYLSVAQSSIIDRLYPYDKSKTTIPEGYVPLQIEIAAYLMNKRGAEGESVHNENGVYRSYTTNGDVPEALLSRIVPKVGVL